MSNIKVDDRVRWQDGDRLRLGWVEFVDDDGTAHMRDEATYGWSAPISNLVAAPYSDEEKTELAALLGYMPNG